MSSRVSSGTPWELHVRQELGIYFYSLRSNLKRERHSYNSAAILSKYYKYRTAWRLYLHSYSCRRTYHTSICSPCSRFHGIHKARSSILCFCSDGSSTHLRCTPRYGDFCISCSAYQLNACILLKTEERQDCVPHFPQVEDRDLVARCRGIN